MKRAFRNFNTLSAKQIKIYAIILTFSLLSFESMASGNEKNAKRDPGMVEKNAATAEALSEMELAIEDWMTRPFNTRVLEERDMKSTSPEFTEHSLEREIAIESWMTAPFETPIFNEMPVENSTCPPAP